MILVQINPLGLYPNKDSRLWDNLVSRIFTVKYVTNNLPAIMFVASGTVTGTIQLFDCEDNAISGVLNLTATADTSYDGTVCTVLKYSGSITSGKIDGFYYYKITLSDLSVIYSDMFEWVTDYSELLKLAFTNCTDILVNGISLPIPAWDFYLEYEKSEEEYETTLDVYDKEGIKNANYGSSHKVYSFKLILDSNVIDLFNVLPVIRGNGEITCTYGNKSHIIDNIETEVSDFFIQTRNVTLKFANKYEAYSMLNI